MIGCSGRSSSPIPRPHSSWNGLSGRCASPIFRLPWKSLADAAFAAGELRRFRASNDVHDPIAHNKTRIAYGDFGPRQEKSSQTVRWPCARLKWPGPGTSMHVRACLVESRRSAVACRTGGAEYAQRLSLLRSPRSPSLRLSSTLPDTSERPVRVTALVPYARRPTLVRGPCVVARGARLSTSDGSRYSAQPWR